MKMFLNKYKKIIAICLIALIFLAIILIERPFSNQRCVYTSKKDYTDMSTSELVYDGTVIIQSFIATDNNLRQIGILSGTNGVSSISSTINVKIIEVDSEKLLLDQNINLNTLEDNSYLEINIENQENSKGKEYKIIIEGIENCVDSNNCYFYLTEQAENVISGYTYNNSTDTTKSLVISETYMNQSYRYVFVAMYTITFILSILVVIFIEKIIEVIKNDWQYFLIYAFLMIFSIVITISKFDVNQENIIATNISSYGIFSLFLICVIGTIYFILLKKINFKEIKLEKVFLMITIPIGLLYLFIYPINTVSDEAKHFYRAYELSEGYLVSSQNEEGIGGRELPTSLYEIIFDISSGNDTVNEWKNRAFNAEISDETTFIEFRYATVYSFIGYLPQALGIFIAKLFTNKIIVMAYFGRLFNFIVSISLMYYALKLIPFKKIVTFIILLLPITLQQTISMSSDTTTLAIALFFIAYILNLKYNKGEDKLKTKDYIILSITSIIMAMCKLIYLPICFLLYLIPKERYKSSKEKYIFTTAVVIISTILNLSWLSYASRYLVDFNEFEANLNSAEQVSFIIKHPVSYIFVMIRTVDLNAYYWIRNITSEIVSSANVLCSSLYSNITFILLAIFMVVNVDETEKKIDIKTKIGFMLVFVIVAALLLTSEYVSWTALQNETIEGVQGRYFIPILILLAYIFNNSNLKLNKIHYKEILLFMIFFDIHAVTTVLLYYS